jgi:hypothetical protein
MKIFKSIAIGFFLLGTTIWGQDSKTTKVMDEMIQIHESLVKETAGKLETKKLVGLLNKGSDDKKDSAVYKAAVPFAEKLGKADNQNDKLNTYSQLVEALAATVSHHDKSKANLFYCPMVKKKWIAKGEKIVNPYSKDMRECGEKQQGSTR